MIARTLAQVRTYGPVSASQRSTRIAVGVIPAAGMLLAIFAYHQCVHCLFRQYDDAYITFRYARNLATGAGLVFNPGENTDSASSFLFTVLLAGCYSFGLHSLPTVALLLGLGSAAATCMLVAWMCLERTRRPLLSIFLATAVGCHGFISGWAISGMETLFFTCLITLAVHRLFILRAFGWPETLLVVAIVLTRFEGLLLAAAWFVLGLMRASGDSKSRRSFLAQVVCVGGTFGLFLSAKWSMYGTLLPHAFQLKQVTSWYAANPKALWEVWKSHAASYAVMAAVGLFTLPRTAASYVFIAYFAASVVSVVLGPYADWVRYSVHLLPVAAGLACVPLSLLFRELPALAVLACGLIGYETYGAFKGVHQTFETGQSHAGCREEVGRYLEAHLAPGTYVLSSDIGAIAYSAPHLSFIDGVGLTSSDILAARARGLSPEPILFSKHPSVLADTCRAPCTSPRDFSLVRWLDSDAAWLTPLPEHEKYVDRLYDGRLMVRCRSTDGLMFGASEFKRR